MCTFSSLDCVRCFIQGEPQKASIPIFSRVKALNGNFTFAYETRVIHGDVVDRLLYTVFSFIPTRRDATRDGLTYLSNLLSESVVGRDHGESLISVLEFIRNS